MADEVAKRLASRASELTGIYTDLTFSPWEESAERQRDFWRELARASQYPQPETRKRTKADKTDD